MEGYDTAEALLASMNPAGRRKGLIHIPYEYSRFSSGDAVERVVRAARLRGLRITVTEEADSLISRSGELHVTGVESVLYLFIAEVVAEELNCP